jgi:hypothetical protein
MAVFERVNSIPVDDYQLRADMARLLCVMVSGWLEQAVYELATERCRRHVSGPVLAYAISQLQWSRNPTTETLAALIGCFDLAWQEEFLSFLTLAQKEAINSVVGLRNDVAHGRWQGTSSLTVSRVLGYFNLVEEVVDYLMDVFDPVLPI